MDVMEKHSKDKLDLRMYDVLKLVQNEMEEYRR